MPSRPRKEWAHPHNNVHSFNDDVSTAQVIKPRLLQIRYRDLFPGVKEVEVKNGAAMPQLSHMSSWHGA
jgi:hypothetical protein